MNHYDYEALIFAEGPLLPEEYAALQAHLRDCQECGQLLGAWQGVKNELKTAPILEPEPGFIARWQTRLEADHQWIHRRQVAVVLGVSLAGAALLLMILAVIWWPVFESPKAYLYAFVYQVINLFYAADTVQGFLAGFASSFTGVGSLIYWILIIGLACQLGVVWLASLRIATKPRRL